MALSNRERQDRWRGKAKYARQIAGLVVGTFDGHPGKILRQLIEHRLEMKYQTVAVHLGITPQRLYNILEGRTAISAEIALRLGKLCGIDPQIWMDWQIRYDLQQSRLRIPDADLENLPQLIDLGSAE